MALSRDPGAEAPTAAPARTDYIADIPKTDLLRVMVALATEVYALNDRVHALEGALTAHGVDLSALDAPQEPAAYDAAKRAERDAFVGRVFGVLAGAEG